MKNNISTTISLSLILLVSTFAGCKKNDDNPTNPVNPTAPKLTIDIGHLAGSSKFYLDSTYTTENGDAFTASVFKYYISNIRLVAINNSEYLIPNSYFLVNQENAQSMELNFTNLPAGNFKAIKFMIGVDSLRNTTGAQTGALDPINGMFWSWNTGYIFMKLEGNSPAVPSAGNEFVYHIGGFKGAYINNREVELSFDGDLLELLNDKHPELHLIVNILEIFKNPHPIDLATFSSNVQMPNANASIIADNYENMFRYDHIHH